MFILSGKYGQICIDRKEHWETTALSWRETQGSGEVIDKVEPRNGGDKRGHARKSLWKGVFQKHFPFMLGEKPDSLEGKSCWGKWPMSPMFWIPPMFWRWENFFPSKRSGKLNFSVIAILTLINYYLLTRGDSRKHVSD